MSPKAGFVLVEEIAPRIRKAVPRSAKTVGAEDMEELIQDCIAMAAQMLHRVEETGKQVTPGNIAYYAILHTRSGRRSTCGSRTDTMASGTQLDGKSCVLSFEEPVGFDMELGEPVSLGEMLAGGHEDPSVAAARHIDWEEFLDSHDHRFGAIVESTAQGRPMTGVAKKLRASNSTLSSLKKRLGAEIREAMGEDVLEQVCRRPMWHGSLEVEHEKVACRADRRR